jgi:hypothetical protein
LKRTNRRGQHSIGRTEG